MDFGEVMAGEVHMHARTGVAYVANHTSFPYAWLTSEHMHGCSARRHVVRKSRALQYSRGKTVPTPTWRSGHSARGCPDLLSVREIGGPSGHLSVRRRREDHATRAPDDPSLRNEGIGASHVRQACSTIRS